MSQTDRNIVVIKIGSSTLVGADGKLDHAYLETLAEEVNALCKNGWQPIVVTSGAIACGLEELGIEKRPHQMPQLQAAASVGQNILMSAYAQAFSRHKITTSVILLTRQITADREQYLHVRDTLDCLLDWNVVPIINENDTVSVEQIRFGDNDTLAALVSCLIKARVCILYSDVDGLYTDNPNNDPNAHFISEVHRITPDLMRAAHGATTTIGSGGMITKIRAARVLLAAGIEMIICQGRSNQPLVELLEGKGRATRFIPDKVLHGITPKKLWIALGDTAKGKVIVDSGARIALVERGSSLLAVGVSGVEGSFEAGDIIDIVDKEGYLFARGKAGASSSEIVLACGRSQETIRSNELFKNLAQHPVVHRDELVVFE